MNFFYIKVEITLKLCGEYIVEILFIAETQPNPF
jgi:hypothetical protein